VFKSRYILGGVLFALFCLSTSLQNPVNTAAAKPQNWRLVWSDEFNYSGRVDPTKWAIDTDDGTWSDSEDEHYTDDIRNVRVENGYLVLEAHKDGQVYSSGRVHTLGPGFKYGRFEIRAKFPAGEGTWPAVWMMAIQQTYGNGLWPDNGEIDIGEHVGREPDQVLANLYTENFNWMNGNGLTKIIDYPGTEQAFHVYACEWDADEIRLSVDGMIVNVFKNPHTNWKDWPFDQKFQVIFDFALGGFGGSEDDTIFPQQMLVDYVRIYQASP
jgi:beta-glucanase (GH16 family)